MDSFFSFLELANELTKKKINCFVAVGLNMRGHAKGLRMKDSESEMVGHSSKDQGRLDCNTLDGQERHQCANIHNPPLERNFCDEQAMR
jgi:hypothetical protein